LIIMALDRLVRHLIAAGRVEQDRLVFLQAGKPEVPPVTAPVTVAPFDREQADEALSELAGYRRLALEGHAPSDVPAALALDLADALTAALAELDRVTSRRFVHGSRVVHRVTGDNGTAVGTPHDDAGTIFVGVVWDDSPEVVDHTPADTLDRRS
jgi:hypothetical protein